MNSLNSLDKLTIKGFKSIKELVNFELNSLNIFVGGNGAGKSNLLFFFKLLRTLIDGKLNRYVKDNGGAGDLLFNGRKVTKAIEFETRFGPRGFRFKLVPTAKDTCSIEDEARYYKHGYTGWWELGDSDDGTSRMVFVLFVLQRLFFSPIRHQQLLLMNLSLDCIQRLLLFWQN